jgi:hypothetical protein
MAPVSQELEPPTIPARFTRWIRIPIGLLFIIAGFLWFLPVVGIEFLLVGLLLIGNHPLSTAGGSD